MGFGNHFIGKISSFHREIRNTSSNRPERNNVTWSCLRVEFHYNKTLKVQKASSSERDVHITIHPEGIAGWIWVRMAERKKILAAQSAWWVRKEGSSTRHPRSHSRLKSFICLSSCQLISLSVFKTDGSEVMASPAQDGQRLGKQARRESSEHLGHSPRPCLELVWTSTVRARGFPCALSWN